MREVKFRIWDKKYKKMIEWEDLIIAKDENESISIFIRISDTVYQIKEYEIMQYTGLKDIDDQEIYEGDLLEHEMEINGIWEQYEASEVIFDEDYGMFCFKDDAPNVLIDCYKNLEIVGNIYENPSYWRKK